MADDPHALRPGAAIAGYNIVRVLGAGGFGITYEADSPFTGKRVAIKEFFPRGIASREGETRIVFPERDSEVVEWALKRFESSTLEQCKLKHPNIVDVIHYVKDNGTGYMIMEYVEGETLEHWLREREFLPTAEELRVQLDHILLALEYLHGRKMIHRDIAPDNIMFRRDGTPVIIDFGAVKLIERATQISSGARSFAVMKQYYSPPEQIQTNAELDHRADIYSMGAVLYRAFSGAPPASAEERMQSLAFAKPDAYVPLIQNAPHLDEGVASAVDRALSFDPDQRQPQISELADELGWSEDRDRTVILSSSPPPFEEVSKPRSKLPWLLPLAGIAALIVAGLFVGGGISLPKFGGDVADIRTPPPALEEAKEIPPMQVQQAPNTDAPKEDAAADGYMVVVASHKTELEAAAALARLKEQLPGLFADQHAEVVGLDLGDQGTFYRVMLGPLVKEEAEELCQQFKKQSVTCLVRMDN